MSIQDNDLQANISPNTHKICRVFRQVTISESHFFPQKKNGVEVGGHSCIYVLCLTNTKLANTCTVLKAVPSQIIISYYYY